jgi:hypothetical protein
MQLVLPDVHIGSRHLALARVTNIPAMNPACADHDGPSNDHSQHHSPYDGPSRSPTPPIALTLPPAAAATADGAAGLRSLARPASQAPASPPAASAYVAPRQPPSGGDSGSGAGSADIRQQLEKLGQSRVEQHQAEQRLQTKQAESEELAARLAVLQSR